MLPLKNKTILITRPANQTSDFIEQLEILGANTLSLPLIKNIAINEKVLETKVSQINYDWIIFTSVNAVHFFFEKIPPKKVTSKIAVVGRKTEHALKNYHLKSDFTPSSYTAKILAKEIPISTNQKIFIPRSDLAKNNIVEILENRNCIVETLSIYANKAISYSTANLDNFFNQKIDFITFTSGSIVQSFMDLNIPISNEKIVCIGPETAEIGRTHKLPIAAIASPHTIEGMINAIVSINKASH